MSRGSRVALAGVLAIAAGLRFAALGHNSIWGDEAYVVWLTQLGWRDVLATLRLADAHPPLYYLLVKAWIHIAGMGEVAIRIPSACLSVLTVVVTYALARRVLPEPVSILSALLVGVSPFEIMAGQEARMYGLLGLLVLASTLALMMSVERGRLHRWGLYAVLGALMVYTQYLGVFVLAAHGIWVAVWERRHLRAWAGSMGVAVLLYAPWVPSLWYQTVHGSGWPWYRRGAAFVDLGDLFGLLAFGGSLLGMGSYFFPGTQGPVGTVGILLPFLVMLGWGIVALRPHPRTLGIIGLPAVVPLAVLSVLALAKLTFYPRWFSFVVPAYAMVLAQGMWEIGSWCRGRRSLVLALLGAGVLCYTVPVLARYYFDPGFRPYPWRAAAALVEHQSRPGDFFLFVNSAARMSLSYYVRDPHPSLTLIPLEASSGADRSAGFTNAEAARLARQYPRVWLIATPPFTAEMQTRLLPVLTSAFRVAGQRTYPAIWVHLLEAKPPAPR